jgi:hypothetical protein
MNYMLLVYSQEKPIEADQVLSKECAGLAETLDNSGKMVAAGILHPTTCATSVRVREGRWLVTDGPFAETREQLAGYIIIDAENLDDAISIAAQHPVAGWGTVEVRPLWKIPSLRPGGVRP